MILYPTPTRRRLLRDTAAGTVNRYQDGQDYVDGWRKCTAAMDVMSRAGWVVLPPGEEWKRAWLITDEGRRIMREAK